MVSERDCCARHEKHRQKQRDYAEIGRNLTDLLQERNKEIVCLQDLLKGTREQLYEERKKYQQLHHHCDHLEFHLFCKTWKAHKAEPREHGDTFEYLHCRECKPLISFDSCETLTDS